MAPLSQKKRSLEDGMRGKTDRPKKRVRKQVDYHSSSDESDTQEDGQFAAVSLNDSDEDTSGQTSKVRSQKPAEETDDEVNEEDLEDSEQGDNSSAEDGDEDAEPSAISKRKSTSKRNDPEAFSTSISKILSTKLSQSARKDPVLSRSKQAVETSTSLADEKLERKAKAKLRSERREDLERGRIKDVLGLNSGTAGEIAEEEKRLRKTAQRGVVKLFNAVRAAQVSSEQAAREERKKGTVGMANREEKANEMSKQGFLDLIGGKKQPAAVQ
ncbi:pre-60S ribosomal particles component [Rhinocladiella similis]